MDRRDRALEVMRRADGRPVTVADLSEAGIHNPAATIYELEIEGHVIEHVHERLPSGSRQFVGFRLAEPEEPPAARRRRGLRRLLRRR